MKNNFGLNNNCVSIKNKIKKQKIKEYKIQHVCPWDCSDEETQLKSEKTDFKVSSLWRLIQDCDNWTSENFSSEYFKYYYSVQTIQAPIKLRIIKTLVNKRIDSLPWLKRHLVHYNNILEDKWHN